MDINLSQTFITVDDHEKALGFYRDALGLEVRKDVGYQGMRWVTVGSPAQPDVAVVLESPLADPSASETDRQAVVDLMRKGLLRAAIFTTDDVDAAFERINASGAEVLREPVDQPYGVRECAFLDPAGNQIVFQQPLS
ncbi:VOC family protein [Streptomyces sp. NRRL F-5727]|uniref:VOC family protein n=1 Tax=Streptomyces sp. NRRL F-5727 TaxID=1463871 RepID=UPI0004CC7F1B|nr:VOC family protein [Streptomyces sp. NRRL F-5727]